MTKAKFEIGENEKHTIIVNASVLLKYIKIDVDGKKVVNEARELIYSVALTKKVLIFVLSVLVMVAAW